MTPAEKPQFAAALGRLCAVFDRKLEPELGEGFWSACQRMRLVQFEYAAGKAAETLERMPKPSQLWTFAREYSARAAERRAQPEREAGEPMWDKWDAAANVILVRMAHEFPRRDSAAGWAIAREQAAIMRILAADGDPAASHEGLTTAMRAQYRRLPEVCDADGLAA